MSNTQLRFVLVDELATQEFGKTLADALLLSLSDTSIDSVRLFLHGELGAGKTTLVRACLRSLGIQGPIKSPTYTLLEPYKRGEGLVSGINIAHLDLYRLLEPEELDYIGVRELSETYNIVFVEWPEKAQGLLGQADINIQLNHIDNGRELLLSANNSSIIETINSIKNS